jgi:GAF domain-containing protein
MTEDRDLKYAEEFARLAGELSREPEEQPTLERIVSLAVQTIDNCDHCGVSVRESDGRITTHAASDPVVERADRLQYELQQGPCLEAIWTLDSYLIEDLAAEDRWPQWCQAAISAGIGSVLSVRLEMPHPGVDGSLNLYAERRGAFDVTDLAVAGIFARHAGTALTGARSQDQLRSALHSRQIIGVAQGVLMQRFRLSLDQSFELLRRYSQYHNVKLRELAENLVRNGGIPIESDDTDTNDLLRHSFGLDDDGS